jgi:hypothetical protein
LVGEGINKPPNSQGLQPIWDYNAHTQGGEVVLKWNKIHTEQNMPLLLGNAVTNDKASQREPRHKGKTPQSRHRH